MPAATACANIALVKYWGKRDVRLNLPAAGSLSVTLDALRTWTSIELDPALADDALVLDGRPREGKERARVSKHLDLIRPAGAPRARVVTRSAFPTAAGLASSASGFAALALAGSAAYGQSLDPARLSVLARRGSGSAARSIFGGFVRWDAGTREDGTDSCARPLEGVDLELAAAIAVARAGEKEIGSTDGMEATRLTSPYHAAWLAQVERDLAACEAALRAKDLGALAEVVEGSCLAMHANAMAARPGILYFRAPTLWAIERVRSLRRAGTPVMFTVDAGPHVVAFTPPAHLEAVAKALADHPEVDRVITSRIGGPAELIEALPV